MSTSIQLQGILGPKQLMQKVTSERLHNRAAILTKRQLLYTLFRKSHSISKTSHIHFYVFYIHSQFSIV